MNTINWSDFNGEKFQSFCNDLLSFVIGKDFIPFSAPGADQGIDGLFEGKYNGKLGKWRFQAKFHHPDTGRIAGFNQLKSQVKKDIDKNIKDETTVIFITNVELNPAQREEIKQIADNALEEGDKSVEFDIWDGAKIHTLLAHHPIVKLWYADQTKFLIQEYSEFFHEELNSATNTSYDLSNKFYHRKDKLEAINKFIQDNTKKVAVVSGEAGIGKTRLCVEFFKQYVDQNNDWKALVIVTHNINLQVLQSALSGERNYVVLLDDVDKFDQRDIADLITLIKGIKNNEIKLLLTVRTPFLNQVLSQITAKDKTDRIEPILLDQLTREETVQFLEWELKGYRIEEYLGFFVELTHGVPIMIMTLLRTIKVGTLISDIKKDSFLKTYVKQYFEQFITTTSEEKEIPKKDIKKIIMLTALIEPIQIEDRNLIQQISSTESLSEEDVDTVLQAMKAQNIISGRYQFDIKPDMYSDLILEEAISSKKWLEKKLPEYGAFINNIIKNIGYVNQDKQNNAVLENLLKEYINRIDKCNDDREIARILDTVYAITYTMPLLAIETIKKTLYIYSDIEHPLYEEFQRSLAYKNYSLDSTINNLKRILHSLFQLEDHFLQAYSYSGRLYQILNDDGVISNIASFGKSDRFEDFTCKRQNRILTASKAELENIDGDLKLFALKALKNILKLEFTDTESHLFQKHSIQIYTLHIPENKYVKKLREEIIDLQIDFFQNETSKALKDETFKVIVDIPREIFAARNKNYKGKKEIKTVLDFLLATSSKNVLELKQKQFIKDQLYWFKRWGIDASYHETIDKINENLSENDLAERLLDLFNPKYEGKINEEIELYRIESEKLVNDNSGTDLGNALVKVIDQSEFESHHFYEFLNSISTNLDKSREIIDHLWIENQAFVIKYCSGMLRQFRFSKEYENIFWDYVNKMNHEFSIEARNCLLHVYHSYSIQNVFNKTGNWEALERKDIDLIINIFDNSSKENYFNLASALPTIFYYDKNIAVKEIKRFLKDCHERQLDSLFLAFDPIEEKKYPEIKDLLLKHTLHLNIPYSVERFLNKIIRKEGFQIVLEYIQNRFLYKRKYVVEKKSLLGYEYVPTHTGNTITAKLSEEQKADVFSMILNWFVDFDFELYEHFYAKKIIELFAVSKTVDGHTKNTYAELIRKYNSVYKKLLNIVQSLSEFEQKNEAFVDLIIMLLEAGSENIKEEKQLKEFTSQCYISLTSLGVKSGTPGQPFAVDIQLKDLLENTLKSSKVKSPEIKDFFQKVLKSVQADIDRDRDEEGGEIW